MNRQPLPREIDAPELKDRGLCVFHGCDASTSRQLSRLSMQYQNLCEIEHVFDEEYMLSSDEHIFALTSSRHNQYISHAVGYLGQCGLKVYRFSECEDEHEVLFRDRMIRIMSEEYGVRVVGKYNNQV